MNYCSVQKKKKADFSEWLEKTEDETGNAHLSQFIKEL